MRDIVEHVPPPGTLLTIIGPKVRGNVLVRCACGTVREIRYQNYRNGTTKSCGRSGCKVSAPKPQSVVDRLVAHSVRVGDCLLWQRTLNHGGYGHILCGPRGWMGVHRAAYEIWVGPIPPGLEIDHLCSVRNCIEPTHLEAVTHAENLRRGARRRKERAAR